MLKAFRDFLMRGNVIDLAVGIIIGSSFTTVVNSLVNDILMPPIGFLIGGVDFSELALTLGENVTINYGLFINAVIQFLIVGLAVFMLVRGVMAFSERFQKPEEDAPAEEPAEDPVVTTEEQLVETLERLNKTLDKMQSSG